MYSVNLNNRLQTRPHPIPRKLQSTIVPIQSGGLGVETVVSAVNNLGKKYKPATKAQDALHKKYGEKYKNNFFYKVADKGLGAAKSILGWGDAEAIIITKKKKSVARKNKKGKKR